jgi:acetyl-CoA carboxylase carboxyltransferase component
MVLDETSIDILRKCQGFIPKNNKEIVSIIEEKQTLEEENKQLQAIIAQLNAELDA